MPPKRRREEEAEFGSLWMHAATSTPPRRKACKQCFGAKVRCDHTRPVCSRCTRRALHCDFSGAASEEPRSSTPPVPTVADSTTTDFSTIPAFTNSLPPLPYPTPLFTSTQPTPQAAPPPASTRSSGDEEASLICTIDASLVRDRWLAGWVPAPDQHPKNLSRGTAVFIHSVLKAYPQMLCKGDFPPIIHKLQLIDGKLPGPLANCLCIARMWSEGLETGSGMASRGREMVRSVTIEEISKLAAAEKSQNSNSTQWDRLAAFQAYIMYATLLVEPHSKPVVTQDIMLNLQDLAHAICTTGLLHPSELPGSTGPRAPWDHWALAEAKRRALTAMYLLDDAVNVFAGVSCIRGDELATLPAPCSEKLWRAESEAMWGRLWDVHVAEWEGGGLRLEELWVGDEDGDGVGRKARVERWARDVDALGTTVLAVTTAIGNR